MNESFAIHELIYYAPLYMWITWLKIMQKTDGIRKSLTKLQTGLLRRIDFWS